VEAATFLVNSTADLPDADQGDGIAAACNGLCTLRAAIMQANYTGGSNTIILPAGVYTLTRPGDDDNAVRGDLDITQPLTIQGAGSGVTIIDGNGAVTGDRVFQILSSATYTSLSGLTIRNGRKVVNTFDEGGGLYWDGGGSHLSLTDVIFENNAARYGGGLYLNYSLSSGDTVSMDHVIVRANTATTAAAGGMGVVFGSTAGFDMRSSQVYSNTAYEAGGIYLSGTPTFGLPSLLIETTEIYSSTASLSAGIENHSGDTNLPVMVLNSRLHDNAAGFYGGAIGNYGTLLIGATTLDSNSASNRGGAIYNYTGGRVAVTNSTISANVVAGSGAGAGGGGIYNEGAKVSLASATLSGNSVGLGSGGGILNGLSFLNAGGTLNITNCTITGNSAATGGGVTNIIPGTASAQNTIIANNTALTATSGPDFAGQLTSQGFNLVGKTNGTTLTGSLSTCLFNVNPLLGPLQNNGGPTFTHALQPGSPAIDAGNSGGLTTDQRGFPRPYDSLLPNAAGGNGADIGAVEMNPSTLLVLNNNDTGAGSLRQALLNNVALGGNNTIAFSSGVTNVITLTSGELAVSTPVGIVGPGANVLAACRT
jgi:CSLREA domain-containing protein